MKDFDIGVMTWEFDENWVYLKKIGIVQEDPHGNIQKFFISRDDLISLFLQGKRICKTRYLETPQFNSFLPHSPYIPQTTICLQTIEGKVFIKATGDRSPCDDLG